LEHKAHINLDAVATWGQCHLVAANSGFSPRREEGSDVRFRITDNLPDMSDQVSREEILILRPIAASLSPAFQVDDGGQSDPYEEEVEPGEGRAIRKSQHSAAG